MLILKGFTHFLIEKKVGRGGGDVAIPSFLLFLDIRGLLLLPFFSQIP